MNTGITSGKIIKKTCRTTQYRVGDSKKPRERSVCPNCDSINIVKRVITRDYKCDRCGWIGENIIRRII